MAPVCQAEDSLSAHFDDLLARQVEAEVCVVNILPLPGHLLQLSCVSRLGC